MVDFSTVKYKGERLAFLDKDRLIEILQKLTEEVNSHPKCTTEYLYHIDMLLATKSLNIIRIITTMSTKLQGFNAHINYDDHILIQGVKTWKYYTLEIKKRHHPQDEPEKPWLITSPFYPNDKLLGEAMKIDIIQACSNQEVFLYNTSMKKVNASVTNSMIKRNTLLIIHNLYITILVHKLDLQKLKGDYRFIV